MSKHPKNSTPILTDDLIEKLSDAIRRGAYVEIACSLVGISKDSFYRWLKEARGISPSEQLLKLSDAVSKAMAEAEMKDLEVFSFAAASGNWKAAAWRLEKRNPRRWGKEAAGLDSEIDNSINSLTKVIDYKKLTTKELKTLIELMEKSISE